MLFFSTWDWVQEWRVYFNPIFNNMYLNIICSYLILILTRQVLTLSGDILIGSVASVIVRPEPRTSTRPPPLLFRRSARPTMCRSVASRPAGSTGSVEELLRPESPSVTRRGGADLIMTADGSTGSPSTLLPPAETLRLSVRRPACRDLKSRS